MMNYVLYITYHTYMGREMTTYVFIQASTVAVGAFLVLQGFGVEENNMSVGFLV